MEKLNSLWEGLKGNLQGSSGGPTFIIHPKLKRAAKWLGRNGHGTEALEEFLKASHERSVLSSVSAMEQEAVKGDPYIMELEEKHHEDEQNKKAVTDELIENIGKHTAKRKEFASTRTALDLEATTRKRDREEGQAQEKWTTYIKECEPRGIPPTGKKIKGSSNLGYIAVGGGCLAVESAANYQAFLKAFPEDMISTLVVAIGASLGIMVMAKLCGSIFASFSNRKARKPMAIALSAVSAIAALAFSIFLGGTRAFGDTSHPLSSHWSEMAALTVNVFLFVMMVAFTWHHVTKREIADAINPLIESYQKHEKAAEMYQTQIDALMLSYVDAQEKIENDYQSETEKAKKHVRTQGIETAKKVGEHSKIHAAIDRQALVAEAACKEAIWSVRLFHLLSKKAKEPKENQSRNLQVVIDPKVYKVPLTQKPNTKSNSISGKSSNT
jgi:hypothetical protein